MIPSSYPDASKSPVCRRVCFLKSRQCISMPRIRLHWPLAAQPNICGLPQIDQLSAYPLNPDGFHDSDRHAQCRA